MDTVPTDPPIPTRAELRGALYDQAEAERAWNQYLDGNYASMLNNTPVPEVDPVALFEACSTTYRALLDIADRLPVGGAS